MTDPAHDATSRMVLEMLAASRSCPWCGELELIVGHGQVAGRQVVCVPCGARGPTESRPIDAIRVWNRRTA